MIDLNFDPVKRRLQACYRGFWSVETANVALRQLQAALDGASTGGQSFTLLDDFQDWSIQNQEVVEVSKRFATMCQGYPIKRNAMIIPSALHRMQISRTVDGLDFCRAFRTFDEADLWLKEIEPCS